MAAIPANLIQAAARRLSGHLIVTPLIGTPWIPGAATSPDIRWKPELLQPGGSGWFRGFQHYLLCQLGALPGLVYAGPIEHLLAAACVAALHRLELHAVLPAPPPAELAALLAAAGTQVQVAAEPGVVARELGRRRGLVALPGPEDPVFAAGLATIGLELAGDLPRSCATVLVPAGAEVAIAAGLAAAGCPATALAPGWVPVLPGLASALAAGHRLQPSRGGLELMSAALAAAQREPVGVVLLA